MNGYVNCYDKYQSEVRVNDFVDVQKAGIHQVYMKDGQLHFKPYGREEKVHSYFSNDMVLCDEHGTWINN